MLPLDCFATLSNPLAAFLSQFVVSVTSGVEATRYGKIAVAIHANLAGR